MVDKLLQKSFSNEYLLTSNMNHIFSLFMSWDKGLYLTDLLEDLLPNNGIVYICCSGGPDSMFLTYLLLRYRHVIKGLPLSITKILHINHNTSESDTILHNIVVKSFGGFFAIKELILPKNKYTETYLRNKRRDFYRESIQEEVSLQCVYLCLGHNLNDRIENSYLHFDRGTHKQGIVNMQQSQKKFIFGKDTLFIYTCIRPLLTLPKDTITLWCDQLQIPYHNDVHNSDMKQKRIILRTRIQQLPSKKKHQLYEEWAYVYSVLENKSSEDIILKKIPYPPNWAISSLYKTLLPSSLEELSALLTLLGLFVNMSSSRLYETMKRFSKKQGAWYFCGRRFLCANGTLFLAQQEQKNIFREERYTSSVLVEKSNTLYNIGGYEWFIQDPEMVGATLTFPSIGDYKGSIPYMQRAAKQHIPFFRRRTLPIAKKNGRIIATLPFTSWLWIS